MSVATRFASRHGLCYHVGRSMTTTQQQKSKFGILHHGGVSSEALGAITGPSCQSKSVNV